MRKPRVTLKCPANAHTGPTERIVEFSFPDGSGGLISFRQNDSGPIVEVYRVDRSVGAGEMYEPDDVLARVEEIV